MACSKVPVYKAAFLKADKTQFIKSMTRSEQNQLNIAKLHKT